MSTVESMTKARIDEITNALVQTGTIDSSGHLILTTRDGTPIDLGPTVSDADLAAIGALTPANDDLIQRKSGIWVNRTVAQAVGDLGGDLIAIENLTPANDDVIQRKAGAWTNRSIAQLVADIIVDQHFFKTTIKTGSTNRTSTTLTDDPDIHVTLDPNSSYDFSFDCSYGGSVAMLWGWTVPTGFSGFHCDSYNQAGTGEVTTTATWNPATTYTAGAVTPGLKSSGWITLGATGGNFAFKWASATSGQTVTLGTAILRLRKFLP